LDSRIPDHRLIAAVLDNPAGRETAWSVLVARWDELQRKIGGFAGIGRVIEAMGAYCSRADVERIRDVLHTRAVPEATRTVPQTLEQVESCAAMRAEHSSALEAWLERGPAGPLQ
jgi:ERAP1-like C-terminal domain